MTQLPRQESVELTYTSGGLMMSSTETLTLPGVLTPQSFTALATADDSADPDIFLQGVAISSLQDGIREAVALSLTCFSRGLYMPAMAMLAAGIEAAWTECDEAVAKKLSNSKLGGIVSDPFEGIGKKVSETHKALQHGDAKALLKAAGQSISKVDDAVIWTTTLRDRRNALHWGKAKSFIVDHADAANLLMPTPIHLGTLEAIRLQC